MWKRLLLHREADEASLLIVAKQLFEIGRFEECARFSQRAWELANGNPDTGAMYAAALERSGRIAEAGDLLQELLVHFPDHRRSLRLLARLERRDGQLGPARARLVEALASSSHPDDWRLRYELAVVLDRLQEPEAAMSSLLCAKEMLAPVAAKHRPLWRSQAERQWKVTQGLSAERLSRWQGEGIGSASTASRGTLLAGFPRSGTTLLESMLTTHPDCVRTDETGILATQFRDPLVFAAPTAENVLQELYSFEADEIAAGAQE